jgi:hypothetical protein
MVEKTTGKSEASLEKPPHVLPDQVNDGRDILASAIELSHCKDNFFDGSFILERRLIY